MKLVVFIARFIVGGLFMINLKACPRCGGDVESNRDIYGHYKLCLRCGHMADVAKPNVGLSTTRAHARVSVKAA